MKKENIFLILSILFGILVLTFSIYTLNRKDRNTTNTQKDLVGSNQEVVQQDTTHEEITQIEEIVQPQKFVHSTWIAPFDFSNGFKSLKQYPNLFTTVTPVFYSVNSDGTLFDRKPDSQQLSEFIQYCNTQNIEVIPTIGSYDFNVMDSVFNSQEIYKIHIQYILNEVERYNFDGIDIDYEKIRSNKKDAYLDFLTLLSQELGSRNKKLSVTVLAKTNSRGTDTLFVQDWQRIGQLAHEVRIMTYDYTLQSSTTPGPISPIKWVEESIVYTIQNIPKEKILMGIPLYSYLWKDQKASALIATSVEDILSNINTLPKYEPEVKEGHLEYLCSNGLKCTLYYQTQQSVLDRVTLAKEYSILGVTYWRLGSEGDLLNSVL